MIIQALQTLALRLLLLTLGLASGWYSKDLYRWLKEHRDILRNRVYAKKKFKTSRRQGDDMYRLQNLTIYIPLFSPYSQFIGHFLCPPNWGKVNDPLLFYGEDLRAGFELSRYLDSGNLYVDI